MEDKAYQINFGRNVRRHRNKKCLTQEELADLCGLDRTYIGSIERGERNVSLINIHKISVALEVNIEDLF